MLCLNTKPSLKGIKIIKKTQTLVKMSAFNAFYAPNRDRMHSCSDCAIDSTECVNTIVFNAMLYKS